ncbi:MAG: energy-coupling factor transporter transmembrane component T [Eubacteriales bacterium]|nr:energy-coupling factor transporter transmembrane component T [Eubacteriales bacterium]
MENRAKGVKTLNPLTILYLIVVLAVVSILFDYRMTLATVAVMILIAAVSGEGVSFVRLWMKSMVLICVVCFALQSLFIPGEVVLWKIWIFSVKQEGVKKAIVLCSRILGVGSAILLGGKLIDIKKLMTVLEKRGVSPSVTYVLLSTTNIIPQMSKKMNVILDAQRSRGIETDSNVLVRAKAFFPAVSPLLLNALVSAEERAITLEARAFSAQCKKTKMKEVADTSADKLLRKLLVVALIVAIGGRIVLWIAL